MGDLGSIPGLGRSPGEGKGYPLQCPGLENSWILQSMGSQRVGRYFHFQTKLMKTSFLKKEMATHSSILAWKNPWTQEPESLQSVGLQRVGHDWVTNTSYDGLLQDLGYSPLYYTVGPGCSSKCWLILVVRFCDNVQWDNTFQRQSLTAIFTAFCPFFTVKGESIIVFQDFKSYGDLVLSGSPRELK